MDINWDILITGGVIVTIALVALARITNQTIKELFTSIRDFISDTKEDVAERGEELVYYE